MRKFKYALSALLLMFGASLASCAPTHTTQVAPQADTTKYSQGLQFEYVGDGYKLVGMGTCKDSEVIIPRSYKNLPVVAVADNAFEGLLNLTKIVLPEGVTTIGEKAFYQCYDLETVEMGYGVIRVGESAFEACSNLEKVTFPGSLQRISERAFYGCEKLAAISLPASLQTIAKDAFFGCTNVKNMTLPFVGNSAREDATYKHLGYLFGGETPKTHKDVVPATLERVTITGNASIGDEAFLNCSSITVVMMTGQVKSIGARAFFGCSGIKMFTLSSVVEHIGDSAFEGCSQLPAIKLPQTIKTFGDGVFTNSLNNQPKKIDSALYYGDKLILIQEYSNEETYVLDSSVKVIKHGAFMDSYKLKTVFYKGTQQAFEAIDVEAGANQYFTKATVYFYSAQKPEVKGNFWHYDAKGNPVAW